MLKIIKSVLSSLVNKETNKNIHVNVVGVSDNYNIFDESFLYYVMANVDKKNKEMMADVQLLYDNTQLYKFANLTPIYLQHKINHKVIVSSLENLKQEFDA